MRNNGPVTGKEQDYPSNANLLSTTTPKGVITFVNKSFAKVAGFEQKELIGQAHNIVRHSDMPQAAFEMLWKRIKSGKSWMGLVKNRCKNGDHYWVNAFVTPINDKTTKSAKEYQSIRVKPERAWVDRATRLYKKLSQGKTPSFIKRKSLSMLQKMSIALWLSVVIGGSLNSIVSQTPSVESNLGLLVGALLAQVALWYLLKPLKQTFIDAQQISEDPVAMHIYTGRNDDIGQIQFAMQVLKTESGALVGRIEEDSGELLNQTQAFMNKVSTSKGKVGEIKAQADEVSSAMEQMSLAIQEVATSASDTASAASEAQAGADKGSDLVIKTANDIEALASNIDKSAGVIEELEKNSENIATILDVIMSIAEQTNLLALNAAIEAARAGEQGRGFAVVADEVRTLANRTHESTEEITEMIKKLREGSQAAVSSMRAAREQTLGSVTQSQQASQAIQQVTDSLNTITDMSQQIASAVEEQSATSNGVKQNIHDLSGLSEELATLSEDNANIGEHLTDLTGNLHDIAQQFFDNKA